MKIIINGKELKHISLTTLQKLQKELEFVLDKMEYQDTDSEQVNTISKRRLRCIPKRKGKDIT